MARATGKQMAAFTKAIIEQRQPRLVGEVEVEFSRRPAVLFKAHRGQGNRVRLLFTMTPKHPHWSDVLDRAIQACYELRYTSTTAEAVCMRSDPFISKALTLIDDRPQSWHIDCKEVADFFAMLYSEEK